MKEFSLINKLAQSQVDPNAPESPYLELGIGDDAAVFKSRTIKRSVFTVSDGCSLDLNSEQSIRDSLDLLEKLIVINDVPFQTLFLNLSLAEIDEQRFDHFLMQLNNLLKQHKILLAGGDTTHGCGKLYYQLIGILETD